MQLIAGPWGVSMNTNLTFHRSGTGPAGRRAGRVPSLPFPAIHPPRQPAIPDEGRSQTIYPASTPLSMKTQHLLATLLVLLFTSIFATASPNVRAFIDGQQKKYKTIDNPKANGLNLIIAYPEDWMPKEGNGPHIVQKFVSENGRGTENVSILIKDTQLDPPTIAEMEEAFNPSNLKHFAPENAKIIKMESSKVEGLPCGIIEYTVEGERLSFKETFHCLTVVFAYKSQIVSICFTVFNTPTSEKSLDEHFETFRPLFLAMAITISLPDKWAGLGKSELPPRPSIREDSQRLDGFVEEASPVLAVIEMKYSFPLSRLYIRIENKSQNIVTGFSADLVFLQLSAVGHSLIYAYNGQMTGSGEPIKESDERPQVERLGVSEKEGYLSIKNGFSSGKCLSKKPSSQLIDHQRTKNVFYTDDGSIEKQVPLPAEIRDINLPPGEKMILTFLFPKGSGVWPFFPSIYNIQSTPNE